MGYFKQRQQRRFNHKYIFVDERKEKLDKIVENAKRDLGMLPPKEETYRDRLRGAFVGENSHLARRKESGPKMSTRFIVGALLVCMFVLYYLLKGVWII
ncbi:MAG: hypothetical protein IKJ95_06900 [Bacteroidaceae bacterium]|nr:hypothetical protein [Bacteroidaceae bacterium]